MHRLIISEASMLAILATSFALLTTPQALSTQSNLPVTTISLAEKIRFGHQIAAQNCQTCHAIGRRGTSPNPAAPQFRHLSRRYPVETLSEAFAEGILVGHSVMPEFEFAPNQVDGLIAYLRSVQTQTRPQARPKTRPQTRPKTKVPAQRKKRAGL